MTDRIADSEIDAEKDCAKRKPYSAPSILSRETLESAANVCSGFGTKSNFDQPNPSGDPNNPNDFCGAASLQS